MTSKAEKARAKKAATIARAAQNKAAKARGSTTPTQRPPAKPRDRKGLDWLLHKERITPRQFWAGTEYGNLYRAVALDGVEPIRSNINMEMTGSGDGVAGFSHADRDIDAQRRLAACHTQALRSEDALIATVAAICGRQLTPREITQEHVETVEIETTLRLALNLLDRHFTEQQVRQTPTCESRRNSAP